MHSGDLRHRLSVLAYQYAGQDPVTGEELYDWVETSVAWAKVEGIHGREFLAAASERSSTTWRVTMRYNAAISLKNRLDYAGTILNIQAMLPDNKRQRMILMCESGVLAL